MSETATDRSLAKSGDGDEKSREAFKRELVALIPHLRAFARTLTGDAA